MHEGVNSSYNGLPTSAELRRQVLETVQTTPVIDIHTHLYPGEFGDLNQYGIDELLTYHYLIAEMFRSTRCTPENFWRMRKSEQADLIWRVLFVENTPLSEATRGVITVLAAFGLDTCAPDLREARAFFQTQSLPEHLDRVLALAGVSDVVMTNDPFDAVEARIWQQLEQVPPRFHAALRLDRLLNDWPNTAAKLKAEGYRVETGLSGATFTELRRYFDRWIAQMKPLYLAVSLPDDFRFPESDARNRLIREIVLPAARSHGLPFAMMVGVRRNVNPALRSAGDGVGRADVIAVERLCAENHDVKFMATFLARENQHELCVAARKFSNLMPFGCWWFLNNPSHVTEITAERLEMLGTSFIPQHSDARILEQLIYKWKHTRQIIGETLCQTYERLRESGRAVTQAEIERDITRMFSGNFCQWAEIGVTEPTGSGERLLAQLA